MAAGQIEEIVQEYGSYVYRFALKLSAQPQDAKDLTQETFLKAWQHLPSLQEPLAIKQWLRVICYNEFKMKLRKDKRISFHVTDVEELEQEGALLLASVPTALDEVQVSEEVKKLRDGCFLAMTRKLTLHQRVAFSLVDMFGLSITEASELLMVTPKAVKGLLYRARMNLASFFKDHCNILEAKNPCRCTAWIEFMKQRGDLQKAVKAQELLDYQKKGYVFDLDTHQKMMYYYQHMPEQRPSDDWFQGVIAMLQKKI